jgi:thiamine pyrophosphate-dependent acetolactate synthase large subunit-like protein
VSKKLVREIVVETLVAAGVKRIYDVVGDSLMEQKPYSSVDGI